MKVISFIFTFFAPCLLFAQLNNSRIAVQWDDKSDWLQILAKAEHQEKYIFVDCYATWCKPCKMMDKNVYVNEKISEYINDNFISVKFQFDTSSFDDETVKRRYKDAKEILDKYHVSSFPTFLFFSSSGKLLHKGFGYKNQDDFMTILKSACDTNKQFYTLIDKYKHNNISHTLLPSLSNMARSLGESNLSREIGHDYLMNYLYNLSNNEILTKENVEYMDQYVQSSNEKGFDLFLRYSDRINVLMGKNNFAFGVIQRVVTTEEIDSILSKKTNDSNDPNWNYFINRIKKKYGASTAGRVVTDAQLKWYRQKKNWNKLAKVYISKTEQYGLDTSGIAKYFANNMIWELFFEHNNDKALINKGIKMMEVVMKGESNSTFFDTYANLLYKAGRVKEGIKWEERAMEYDIENAKRNKRSPKSLYSSTLEKMRVGEPTWPIQNN